MDMRSGSRKQQFAEVAGRYVLLLNAVLCRLHLPTLQLVSGLALTPRVCRRAVMGDRSPDAPAPEGRLDSWKEIAAYLNRAVTTVQRWEKREGMPVYRHVHERRGSVYAFQAELAEWAHEPESIRPGDEHGRIAKSFCVCSTVIGSGRDSNQVEDYPGADCGGSRCRPGHYILVTEDRAFLGKPDRRRAISDDHRFRRS